MVIGNWTGIFAGYITTLPDRYESDVYPGEQRRGVRQGNSALQVVVFVGVLVVVVFSLIFRDIDRIYYLSFCCDKLLVSIVIGA